MRIRHIIPIRVVLAASIPLLTLGCAHSADEAEVTVPGEDTPQLAQLRRENATLRTRVQNLEERVRMIEHGGADVDGLADASGYERYGSVEASASTEWGDPEDDGPRELPVVKLTPSGKSIDRREVSDSPAPSKPKGKRGSISLSPVPHSGAPEEYVDDYVVDGEASDEPPAAEPATESNGSPASYRLVGSKLVQATQRKPVAGPSRDHDTGVVKDYKSAMSLYEDGKYAEAESAFSTIVSGHPDHDYADNALYWQGEAAYDQAHYADALAAFTKVVEHYGGGSKAPDALLKIGLCYGRLGDAANARDVLTQLIAAYPTASASKIAKRKLDDLE